MAIAITIGCAVLICTLIIIFSRRHIERTYSSIDMVLDHILAQNPNIPVDTRIDNRLSKMTHKAVKIIQMNAMNISQLGQEKETIQGFVSDMSHQMKTPLSGISMYADLLLEGNISQAEQQEFIARIKLGADKLQWMMDSLLKMSRLEIGSIVLSPAPAGIKQTLSDSISMALSAANQKNITIETTQFEDVLLFHDRKWTSEAMLNILENAVKYSAPNSEIRISLEPFSLYTKINITDYGIGIAREEWNAIFKRFYRGENAKNIGGAGLGLYLAALILEKQGGYILVDSKPGRYTTFSMFLQNCKNQTRIC